MKAPLDCAGTAPQGLSRAASFCCFVPRASEIAALHPCCLHKQDEHTQGFRSLLGKNLDDKTFVWRAAPLLPQVGVMYQLDFAVISVNSGLVTQASRLIAVIPPCPEGQNLCDSECVEVRCNMCLH